MPFSRFFNAVAYKNCHVAEYKKHKLHSCLKSNIVMLLPVVWEIAAEGHLLIFAVDKVQKANAGF